MANHARSTWRNQAGLSVEVDDQSRVDFRPLIIFVLPPPSAPLAALRSLAGQPTSLAAAVAFLPTTTYIIIFIIAPPAHH